MEDPYADEAVEAWDAKTAVGHTGSNDHRSCDGLASVGECDDMMIRASNQSSGWLGEHKLGTERHCLLPRPVRQIASADAAREAQIVAD
jgi:hypothetical protein